MLPEVLKDYLDKHNKSDRGKILKEIALLTESTGFESAVESVENALLYNVDDIDSLKNLHSRLHGKIVSFPPISLSSNVPELTKVTPNLTEYDAILEKAGVKKC